MAYSPKQRRSDAGLERQCHKCGEWWCLESFARDPACKAGRTSECTACRQQRRKGHAPDTRRSHRKKVAA